MGLPFARSARQIGGISPQRNCRTAPKRKEGPEIRHSHAVASRDCGAVRARSIGAVPCGAYRCGGIPRKFGEAQKYAAIRRGLRRAHIPRAKRALRSNVARGVRARPTDFAIISIGTIVEPPRRRLPIAAREDTRRRADAAINAGAGSSPSRRRLASRPRGPMRYAPSEGR